MIMKRSKEDALERLLVSLFDADALHRFIRDREELKAFAPSLPDRSASLMQLVEVVVAELVRRGLVTAVLFAELAGELPNRERDIESVAREIGVDWTASGPDVQPSSPRMFGQAIGLLRIDDTHGCTAWLVADDRAVTSRAALDRLPAGFPLAFELDGVRASAMVIARAADSDCAVVELKPPFAGRCPLPIAGRLRGRAAGKTLGYSQARPGWAVPLDGLLVLPPDGDGVATVQSDVLSVHLASPHHCFEGAPILVDDHVVAMLGRPIEREGAAGRALSGMLRACPSAQILACLGAEPDRAEVGDEVPRIAPAIGEQEFHTFVSFSPADIAWARALEERLRLDGFRSFLAEPGQPELADDGPLASNLRLSRSGVVLLSRAWQDTRACQAIGALLQLRRLRDPEFRLVVVLLDEAPLAPPWSTCYTQDFRGTSGPSGPRWDDLVHALVWRTTPLPTTPTGAIGSAERGATDSMEEDLRAAAQAGATEVMNAWRGWQQVGALPLAPSLRAAEFLIAQARSDLALEILAHVGDSTRAEQLRALALSRTGKEEEAIRLLERLHKRLGLDAETMGLLAGRYKRRGTSRGPRVWLEKGQALYAEAYQRFGDSYNGINAATLALHLGQLERAQQFAREVIALLEAVPERSLDHWKIATIAEAWHLVRDLDKARARYAQAVRLVPEFYSDIAVMRTQARRNARVLGDREDVFDDIMTIPRVVVCVGHLEDAPNRPTPRLPPYLGAGVREAIRARLSELRGGFGFSALARGADILFVDEMLKRRSQVKVILPFAVDEFEKTSVGPRWAPRYRELLADPRVELQILDERMPSAEELPQRYFACTDAIFQRAIRFAEELGEQPVLLAVWGGKPGEGSRGPPAARTPWPPARHQMGGGRLGGGPGSREARRG